MDRLKYTWEEVQQYAEEISAKRVQTLALAYKRRIQILEQMNKNFYDYIQELEKTQLDLNDGSINNDQSNGIA
jgi:hypothetical protein